MHTAALPSSKKMHSSFNTSRSTAVIRSRTSHQQQQQQRQMLSAGSRDDQWRAARTWATCLYITLQSLRRLEPTDTARHRTPAAAAASENERDADEITVQSNSELLQNFADVDNVPAPSMNCHARRQSAHLTWLIYHRQTCYIRARVC